MAPSNDADLLAQYEASWALRSCGAAVFAVPGVRTEMSRFWCSMCIHVQYFLSCYFTMIFDIIINKYSSHSLICNSLALIPLHVKLFKAASAYESGYINKHEFSLSAQPNSFLPHSPSLFFPSLSIHLSLRHLCPCISSTAGEVGSLPAG